MLKTIFKRFYLTKERELISNFQFLLFSSKFLVLSIFRLPEISYFLCIIYVLFMKWIHKYGIFSSIKIDYQSFRCDRKEISDSGYFFGN